MDDRPEDGFMERPGNADRQCTAKANARLGGGIRGCPYLRHKASLHKTRDDPASIYARMPEP